MTKDLTAAARLFDVADTDDAVIDTLMGLVRTLKASRRAKAELAGMPSAKLREVLLFRAQEQEGR